MLQENIAGINIVQLFRREQFNAEMFRQINNRYVAEVDKTIFYDSAVSATLEWISLVAIAGVLWLGGLLILQDAVSFGVLASFILYAQRLFDPLRRFAEKFTMLQAGFTAVERISDIMNEPIEIRDPEGLQVQRLPQGVKLGRLNVASSEDNDHYPSSSALQYPNPSNLQPLTLAGEI